MKAGTLTPKADCAGLLALLCYLLLTSIGLLSCGLTNENTPIPVALDVRDAAPTVEVLSTNPPPCSLSPKISPEDISACIDRHGSREALWMTFYQDAHWQQFVKGVIAAEPGWLKVADLFYPYLDAGAGEELGDAIGLALGEDPLAVFRTMKVVRENSDALKQVCYSTPLRFFDSWAERHEAIKNRLRAVEALRDQNYEPQRTDCLREIRELLRTWTSD